jgi:hypothetical protein
MDRQYKNDETSEDGGYMPNPSEGQESKIKNKINYFRKAAKKIQKNRRG